MTTSTRYGVVMTTTYNKTEHRRTSFGRAVSAHEYHQHRPSYPAAAVHAALGDPAVGTVLDVVDVGAGTGLLSLRLREAGHRVTAVEPAEEMRAVLDQTLNDQTFNDQTFNDQTFNDQATIVAGTGERTSCPDHSADALVYGQAWHWVDPAQAAQEARRVLRPDGTLAMLWNMTAPEDVHYRHILKLAGRPDEGVATANPPALTGFTSAVVTTVPWQSKPLTAGDIVALARTWSWFAIAEDRSDREAAITAYVTAQPNSVVTLQQHTLVYCYQQR